MNRTPQYKAKQREYARRWYATPEGKAKKRAYAVARRSTAEGRAKLRWRKDLPTPTRPEPVVCECCGRPPTKKSLAVDHDHVTGKFRGWLCHRCNMGLGLLGDTVLSLRQALKYLAFNS